MVRQRDRRWLWVGFWSGVAVDAGVDSVLHLHSHPDEGGSLWMALFGATLAVAAIALAAAVIAARLTSKVETLLDLAADDERDGPPDPEAN